MNRMKRLVFNTALLTSVSLLIRVIGMGLQVYLVSKIGSAGIGLFTLVLSVGSLAATFAISGIRFTSTRLISEELGVGNSGSVSATVTRCCTYATIFGTAGTVILLLTAERIGFLWIGDARTVLSLEIFSFSLPFISTSAVLGGYFTSTGRVHKSAGVQFVEEVLRVVFTVWFMQYAPDGDLELGCAAVILASVVSNIISFVLLLIVYKKDRQMYKSGITGEKLTRRMLFIAMPLALSAYARVSLTTLQQLLVPRGLMSSGASADKAMSDYGTIQGMAVPVVAFPACFLLALNELLVPELTEAQVVGNNKLISKLTSNLLEQCLVFSVGVTAILFTFSHELGMGIYNSAEAGEYIKILSLLVPLIYMDLITDGCLKGLGEMLYSMCINVVDSVISVALVIILLPKYGIMGFIVVIFITEFINFALSMQRLCTKAKIVISLRRSVVSIICAIAAAQGVELFFRMSGITYFDIVRTIFAVILSGLAYLVLLILCGCIDLKSHTIRRALGEKFS